MKNLSAIQSHPHNVQPLIQAKIDAALIDHAYDQSYTGLGTSLFCATVILFGLYNTGINATLLEWYGFFAAVTLMRFILTVSYFKFVRHANRLSQNSLHIQRWRYLFVLGAFIAGISWGLTGGVLITSNSSIQTSTLIILILAGISAGAVPVLAAILSAAIFFVIPAVAMLIVNLYFLESHTFLLFDIAALAFLVYLCVIAVKTHRIIENSFKLQFENSELIQELAQVFNELEFNASHDVLTKVANRSLFEISLNNSIRRASVEEKMVAILYIDLDNFKEVNDTYGHNIGDQVLLTIVGRLTKILRKTDIISRVGGDEFTIILENVSTLQNVEEIARKINETIAAPIKLNDLALTVTVCIGISIFPKDGVGADELVKAADKAMYYVKQHGHNNFYFNIESEEKPT